MAQSLYVFYLNCIRIMSEMVKVSACKSRNALSERKLWKKCCYFIQAIWLKIVCFDKKQKGFLMVYCAYCLTLCRLHSLHSVSFVRGKTLIKLGRSQLREYDFFVCVGVFMKLTQTQRMLVCFQSLVFTTMKNHQRTKIIYETFHGDIIMW